MAKPIAEYRTSGGATVTAKSGLLSGYTWECDGCGSYQRDIWDDANRRSTFPDSRSLKDAANTHANACRAIPRPRRNAAHNAGATSARKD